MLSIVFPERWVYKPFPEIGTVFLKQHLHTYGQRQKHISGEGHHSTAGVTWSENTQHSCSSTSQALTPFVGGQLGDEISLAVHNQKTSRRTGADGTALPFAAISNVAWCSSQARTRWLLQGGLLVWDTTPPFAKIQSQVSHLSTDSLLSPNHYDTNNIERVTR